MSTWTCSGSLPPRRRAHRRHAGHAARAARRRLPRSTTSRPASSPNLYATLRPRTRPTGSTRCSRTRPDPGRDGWPPLAPPIGQVLAWQALLNVLAASRYPTVVDELRALVSGRFGTPPAPIDPALVRVNKLTADPDTPATPHRRSTRFASSRPRRVERGGAAPVGLFGDDAERVLARHRGRGRRDEEACPASTSLVPSGCASCLDGPGVGIGEVTIEEEGMRVSVRAGPDMPVAAVASRRPLALPEPARRPRGRPRTGSYASSRRWSGRSTGRGSRERRRRRGGRRDRPRQTLYIFEAMKLMNEVKDEFEAVVR